MEKKAEEEIKRTYKRHALIRQLTKKEIAYEFYGKMLVVDNLLDRLEPTANDNGNPELYVFN